MGDATGERSRPFDVPTGTVSFLSTEIQGVTDGAGGSDDDRSADVRRSEDLLAEAIVQHQGVRPVERGRHGDPVAAFARASDAVLAALSAQRALVAEDRSGGATVRVRMAVHTGEAHVRDDGNYFGSTVTRCARIRQVAHGSQVLVSEAAAMLVVDALPDDVALVDLGRIRLKDLGRPERVWQLTHPDLPLTFPPLRGLEAYWHNLPAQPSPLVGRSGEIADLGVLLLGERLVTLTGSGGVGKTRLALAVAAESIDAYPGGVWFVDLAVTGGSDSAARATLRALDVPESPSLPPTRQVALELAARDRAMVVLDNCEHTLEDCTRFVADLSAAEPRVTVLATSREHLDVPGEVSWRVPSLTVPATDEPAPVDVLSQYDAVTLFVDRARRARPSFRIDDANAPTVAQICAQLDGIPLAIELAAARCRHLSVERILAGLDDRFRLLRDGSPVVRPRHQTLAASVEWSHDLLQPDEQVVLRRLGVFAGSFELDAAEHVVSAIGDVDPAGVPDQLGRLVDKSLLLAVDDDTGLGGRFRLLETIRAFARRRAEVVDELARLRDVHARWWCTRLRPAIAGPTDDVVAMVETDLDDILAALAWAAENDEALGLDILHGLARPLHGAGRTRETLPVIERLLAPGAQAAHPERWLAAAIPASVPMAAHLGLPVFHDVLARCEAIAIELGLPFRLAVTRWLRDMNIDTGAAMIAAAAESDDPSARYVTVLGTVRRAIDCPVHAPDEAAEALGDAVRAADSYPSAYLRNYAVAARGVHGLLFGDPQETIRCGQRMRDDRSLAIRDWGKLFLVLGGLFAANPEAIESAISAADRDAERGMPHASTIRDYAQALLHTLADPPRPVAVPRIDTFPHNDRYPILISGRVALVSGDEDGARATTEVGGTASPGTEAARQITLGLLDDDEHAWHEALRIAGRHGYRSMAVDALEGVAVAAARADSSTEALRLLGAADRLRGETGYRLRFPNERRRVDDALSRARAELDGATVEAARDEGRALDLAAATEYARRARGERKRPRHGWDSLTPTELRVVDAVTDGLTNPEIADRLLMSRSTVKTHLEHVYAKVGVNGRAQLAAEHVKRQTRPPSTAD
jgi:predicted ATPase/class 3 adenylate cyclase/DNA-binding CsgD family transcriptional regulator